MKRRIAENTRHCIPTREENQVVVTAAWQCTILQYWEDEAAVAEGLLFRGHFRKPSALVEYITFQVNLGLDAGFQIEWPSIVGSTLLFAVWQHMSDEEFRQFYGEKMLEKLSRLERATKNIWCHMMEESVVRDSGSWSVAPFQATPSPPQEGAPGIIMADQPEDRSHEFQPGPSWSEISGMGSHPRDPAPYQTWA